MIKTYRKGYMLERKIVHALNKKGFAVIRAPRSGSMGVPSPDIVAAKDGRLIVLECKARKESFSVDKSQLDELKEWVVRAGAEAYIAWKLPYKDCFFIPLSVVVSNNGNVNKSMLKDAKTIKDFR